MCPVPLRGIPFEMSASRRPTKASSVLLVCRALRATSVIPFLLLSNSSRTIIGRNTSCSSKRKRHMGSCINTFVSRTKSLTGPDKRVFLLFLIFGRLAAADSNLPGSRGEYCGAEKSVAFSCAEDFFFSENSEVNTGLVSTKEFLPRDFAFFSGESLTSD